MYSEYWNAYMELDLKKPHISLVPGSSTQDTALKVCLHQCWTEGEDHLPRPAGNASLRAAQDTVSHLCYNGKLLSHVQPGVPQVLFCKATFQPVTPACPGASGCSCPGTSPSWTSWGSCQPMSPACWGSSEWQQDPPAYEPLLPVLCHQQTRWHCKHCAALHSAHIHKWTGKVRLEKGKLAADTKLVRVVKIRLECKFSVLSSECKFFSWEVKTKMKERKYLRLKDCGIKWKRKSKTQSY